jgi:hypothetical protein
VIRLFDGNKDKDIVFALRLARKRVCERHPFICEYPECVVPKRANRKRNTNLRYRSEWGEESGQNQDRVLGLAGLGREKEKQSHPLLKRKTQRISYPPRS